MKKESFVYVGLLEAPHAGFFVKVGKSDNPWERRDKYFTHCPGGLLSMHATRCGDAAAALALERKLRNSVRALPSASNAGGEWTRISSASLDDVYDLLDRIVGPSFPVEALRHRRMA